MKGRRLPGLALAAVAFVAAAWGRPTPAPAEDAASDSQCRVVQFELTPTAGLQLVAWIEDEAGNFVDTAFITRLTGTYGLGNRPGMMEFNSGLLWPYGRRTTTFPVWTGRHGMEWPLVVFQNKDDTNLSHPLAQSSLEHFYCRPIREDESMWDSQTCATTVYTDKGALDPEMRSKYPPRSDHDKVNNIDHPSVDEMAGMNPFDSVSRATPPGGQRFRINWAIPEDLPNGDYVAWVEANKEFDQNGFYDYPEPVGIPWAEYGVAYRGQPSVLWRIPFTVGDEETVTSVLDYHGYGDPDGLDHDVREPDVTISTGVAGSGAGRLLVTAGASGDMYRVQVLARPGDDDIPPGGAGQFEVLGVEVEQGIASVTASFIAPGDDDQEGTVSGYEIRYLAGRPITDENFHEGMPAAVTIDPLPAGTVHEFTLAGLLPSTNYYIGVRAYDECLNMGPVISIHALTPDPEAGKVGTCFVATAAYGTPMATEVAALRGFRDRMLRTHVPGELLVGGYYTFSPALAAVIGRSETLRRAARAALAPVVERVSTR